MTVETFLREFPNLSHERKVEFISKLASYYLDDPDFWGTALADFLTYASDDEADDYFGTEGFSG